MNVIDYLDELPNNTSIHSKTYNAVYYRGNGANTTVCLPQYKTVNYIRPFHAYSVRIYEDNYSIVFFDRALDNGELVKISLKDN